jgi:hypothetical protein
VPVGAPSTGLGGASHSADGGFIALGVLALMGAVGSLLLAMRRREVRSSRGTDEE